MIPYSYNMVDMGGIDLAEANGTIVEGLYNRLALARNACGDLILFNWKFAEIEIAPAPCSTLDVGTSILINGLIQVTEQDEVSISGIVPDPTIEPLIVVENGTYTPAAGVDGFSPVEVDVSPILCNENILCNWDFNNIVNTRGQESYSSGYGFDGWTVYNGTVIRRSGGISIVKSQDQDFMLSGQFLFRSDAVAALFGKTITISALVDNEFGSYTFEASSSGDQDQGHLVVNGLHFYFYRDSATQMPFYMLSGSNDEDNKIIRAVKAEFGSVSTLATLVDGEWVLNETGDQVTEFFRVREAVRYQ